jgi:polysaccharide deacetylase family protein (PEP-CTERM system associated)
MMNVLSFDIEEWFCVTNFTPYIKREDWQNLESRVEFQTALILDMLKKYKTKATFFVLGWVAERHPDLIKWIYKEGHEIATHGYSHRLLSQMDEDEFKEDLKKSLEILENITGEKIIGHRACSFSLKKDKFWALDIMLDFNLKYDSSIFPVDELKNFPRYPFLIRKKQDKYLIEFPLSTIKVLNRNIRVLSGGPFRLTPLWLSKFIIRNKNKNKKPAILTLHSWEFDPKQPRIRCPNLLSKFRHYLNLNRTEERLKIILSEFEFFPFKEVINKFIPK